MATAALVLSAFSERSGDQATELGPKFVDWKKEDAGSDDMNLHLQVLCRLFLLFLAVLALCVNLSDTVPSTAVCPAVRCKKKCVMMLSCTSDPFTSPSKPNTL